MKKLLFILTFILSIGILHSQNHEPPTISISGTKKAEVGINYPFTAKVTLKDSNDIIKSYEWSVKWNGKGISGDNGIKGDNSKLLDETKDTLSTFSVKWGDFFESCGLKDDISLVLTYTDVWYEVDSDGNQVKNSTTKKVEAKDYEVKILWITTPTISGPSSIQKCCTSAVEYCANACNANYFDWSVTGGTIDNSPQHSKCIKIIPSSNEDVSISVTARRNTGITQYKHNSSTSISRHTPVTPKYEGPNIFCKGEEYKLCVPEICGMSGVQWQVPNTLTIIDGQGTNCITITPNLDAPDGYYGNLTYSAILNGGCQSIPASSSFRIFSSETPPKPVGELVVTIDPGENYDPCNPETWGGYKFDFIGKPPYKNGYTTVSPKVFIPVAHHLNEFFTITIKVCNFNACSGESNCVSFTYNLPNPCFKEDDFGKLVIPIDGNKIFNKDDKTKTSNLLLRDEKNKLDNVEFLKVSPNPFNQSTKLIFPHLEYGTIEVIDITGNVILSQEVYNTNEFNIILNNKFSGTYFVKLNSKKYSVVKKLILQN